MSSAHLIELQEQIKLRQELAEELDRQLVQITATAATAPTVSNLVKCLAHSIECRKAAELAEKELKVQVRRLMGTEAVLQTAEYVVLLEEAKTTSLDRDALTRDLGESVLAKYLKVTYYPKLTVRSVTFNGG